MSQGASWKEWTLAIQSKRESLSEQKMPEKERSTVRSRRIVPGTYDGKVDVCVDGCKITKKRLGLMYARSILTRAHRVTVRVVLLDAVMIGWFVTRKDEKATIFHAALEGQEEVCRRTLIWFWQRGFTIKETLWILVKALCGLRSAPKILRSCMECCSGCACNESRRARLCASTTVFSFYPMLCVLFLETTRLQLFGLCLDQ